jgi:hypothetical protein
MTIFEGPVTSAPGLSVFETVVTFLVIPTVMFVGISAIAYALTAPKKSKAPSAITSID